MENYSQSGLMSSKRYERRITLHDTWPDLDRPDLIMEGRPTMEGLGNGGIGPPSLRLRDL